MANQPGSRKGIAEQARRPRSRKGMVQLVPLRRRRRRHQVRALRRHSFRRRRVSSAELSSKGLLKGKASILSIRRSTTE